MASYIIFTDMAFWEIDGELWEGVENYLPPTKLHEYYKHPLLDYWVRKDIHHGFELLE